jgi:hypothetical protein
MLRYHMSVVTRDPGLKRSIKRLTTATGATADFAADATLNPTRPINLAIFDARNEQPDRRFLNQVPKSAHIIYIVPGEDLFLKVQLFEDVRTTSLFCYDERFDDDEFISSATKALHGEIFGLQKYFPWGVTTFSMVIKNYEEKGRAIEIMMRYAQMAGVRGPVRDRIQLVADELMMNALYHAPVDERGQERFRGMTQKQLAQLSEVSPIQVQYGCSGRYFGIAVRDGGGSLARDRALEYLVRARAGAQMEQKASGAGLGLISVLHSVSKLVFNLAPGYSTEVIGLFDMELFARGKVGARSLHLFTASASAAAGAGDDPAAEEEETRVNAPRAPARRRGGAAAWFFAAILGAAAAALSTAYYFKRVRNAGAEAATPQPAAQPTLTFSAEPKDAEIRVNGHLVDADVALAIPPEADQLDITVSRTGYRTWSRTLSASTMVGSERIFVALERAR